ncbi:MAG: hypothetical protein JW820_17845 [Spirochaetales bacterium]|nr:hypothetical protein [Spirochaetales bacterium]
MSTLWSEPFTVHTYEVGAGGRASIQALCAFLQEAAGRNADAMGLSLPQLMEKGLTWVLSRLLVRVYEYPRWWEKLLVQTWPSGFHRLFALREWRIFRGDELLGEATSSWLMVHVDGRRPVRPDSHGEWAGRIYPQRAIPVTLEKLPDPQSPDLAPSAPGDGAAEVYEGDFGVRYRDLDMNGHANNLSYLDWLLEILPPAFRDRHTLGELELNFLAELGPGETVRSRAVTAPGEAVSDDAAFGRKASGRAHPGSVDLHHTLACLRDGRIAARARTRWLPSA